jgi:hypothetical protein
LGIAFLLLLAGSLRTNWREQTASVDGNDLRTALVIPQTHTNLTIRGDRGQGLIADLRSPSGKIMKVLLTQLPPEKAPALSGKTLSLAFTMLPHQATGELTIDQATLTNSE